MKTGTKSILFGAHCFFLHPFFVWKAWIKLFGKPNFPTIISFFVHDLGYWSLDKMDDEKGEMHPYFGANLMHKLFDKNIKTCGIENCSMCKFRIDQNKYWFNFTLYHSRFLAKKNDEQFSKLCVADKLSICLTPSWLYIPMATLSGEINEYMKDFEKSNYTDNNKGIITKRKFDSKFEWHKSVKKYVFAWVEEHKDMKKDEWTSKNRNVLENGTWK
jgi:hypothetical protein